MSYIWLGVVGGVSALLGLVLFWGLRSLRDSVGLMRLIRNRLPAGLPPMPRVPPGPRKARLAVVGLGFTEVPSGECRTITVSPQRNFRLRPGDKGPALCMPGNVAQHFAILKVTVGGELVGDLEGAELSLAADGNTVAEFTPPATWPGSEPGHTIALMVCNVSDRPQTFCGMLLGTGDPPELGSDVSFALGQLPS